MALGKVRTNKRQSSTSYASTITTGVFITICVLGVWMLTTTDSVVPPQTTSRTTTATRKNPHTTATAITKKDSQAYGDNPGDLPDDVIETNDRTSETGRELENNNHGDGNQSVHDHRDDEDQSRDGERQAAKENSNGFQGKESQEADERQDANQAQASEDGSAAQKETVEETNDHQALEDQNRNLESHETKDEGKSLVSDQTKELASRQKESGSGDRTGDTEDADTERVRNGTKELASRQEQSGGIQASDQTRDLARQQNQETQTEEQLTDGPQKAQYLERNSNKAQSENQQNGSEPKATSEENPIQEPKQSEKPAESKSGGPFGGENSGIPKESTESKKSWATQADQSENQKERRKDDAEEAGGSIYGYTWQLCNVTAGPDYIPCLDNEKAISKLRSRKHFEHRERHCPEEGPTCLVPVPEGYKTPIHWPASRDKIWYHNVPHTLLAEVKGHQNWVKVTGEFLTFPGGGTQFIHGALHYIDFLQNAVPSIAWGKHARVVLDVGCGVASFGGFLFERDVLTMSFAPKDEHEAQVQFALERGIPAVSAVMGSQRLPFPSRVFDVVHCARCRVPWHAEGGLLLLELNRVLRPGGFFIWSATPVYQKLKEDVEIWKEMSALTASMCWEVVTIKRDRLNSIGAAIYRKPTTNECYDKRKHNRPPMCKTDDDPNAAWYVRLQPCMHRVPEQDAERGTHWPEEWPARMQTPPYWLNRSQMGIYGKPAPEDFAADYEHWKRVVSKLYLNGLGITWSDVRNVMDMRAVYGGFAAALKDLKIWVLNVVNVNSPDTLPIIYERGLFGIYHDWCESFSTYPRTYDLLHADHLFSVLKKRCKLVAVMAEIDRIVRPGGKLIIRDESSIVGEVENLLKSLRWEVHLTFSKDQEGILSAQKSGWRPTGSYAASS